MKTFSFEPWSIEMLLPDAATTDFDDANQFLTLHLSWKQSAQLKLIKAPPLTSLAQIPQAWSWGAALKILSEGIAPYGIIYRLVTFEVRVGAEGLPGQHIHWMETVSRVYAMIPLSETLSLECVVYVEFDMEKSPDTMAAAKDLCLSIRAK